jgi:hypothetical protein
VEGKAAAERFPASSASLVFASRTRGASAPSRPDFRLAKADAAKTVFTPVVPARSGANEKTRAQIGAEMPFRRPKNLCELPKVILRYSRAFLKSPPHYFNRLSHCYSVGYDQYESAAPQAQAPKAQLEIGIRNFA